VMEAEPILATLGARHRIFLEAEDREIEVAVAEIVAARAVGVELADLLHVENVGEELCGRLGVLGGDCDVLDLRHGRLSICWRALRRAPASNPQSRRSSYPRTPPASATEIFPQRLALVAGAQAP